MAREVRVSKRILEILLAAGLTIGAACAADSPFIGNWKLDPSKSRLPDEMTVADRGHNTYAFDFGAGAETIVVDGRDQPGYGGTLLSVKPAAPDTWIVTRKKDGALQLTATWKLSKDGRTLRDYFRGATLSMDYVYERAGAGSGFAGDWRSIKETMNTPLLMQVAAFQGDGLSFITPAQHVTRNVRFDGKDYPGAAAGTSSSARRVDERTLIITNKAAGTVSDTREVQLSPDRKTLTMTVHIPGRAAPNVMVFGRS
jgi:hypothetical protein